MLPIATGSAIHSQGQPHAMIKTATMPQHSVEPDWQPPDWLDWAKRLQSMAQTGLTYSRDPYDIARYHEITEIAVGMFAQGAGVPPEQVRAVFAQETGHATPKLDVRTAVFRAGERGAEVLLVREKSDGLWTLPGGWADVGETPSEAAAREVLEESGYTVRIGRVLALWDKRRHPHPADARYIYKLVFAGEIVGTDGPGGDGHETDGVDFFPADALPPLSVRRVTESQIAALFGLHAATEAPTLFD
jgi:ADP-ribose pyrophosphatase YjhB (NUDIX family)